MFEQGWKIDHRQPLVVVFGKQSTVRVSQFSILVQTAVGVSSQLIGPLLSSTIYHSPVNEGGDFVQLLSRVVWTQTGALIISASEKWHLAMVGFMKSVFVSFWYWNIKVLWRTSGPLRIYDLIDDLLA